MLCVLYETLTIMLTVIFINARQKVEWLIGEMPTSYFFTLLCMVNQTSRKNVSMREFCLGSRYILVTTAWLIFGIDVQVLAIKKNKYLPPSQETMLTYFQQI